MASANVESVRRLAAAIDGRDFAAAARLFHSNAEWRNTDAFPGPSVCAGPDEIARFWRDLLEDFEAGGLTVEDTTEAGDTVVALFHSRGRGKASGVPIEVRWAASFRFGEGKILRADVYGDYARALEAAGIWQREPGTPPS
jgi:ketosteroid isomerase-like protein